MVWPPSPVGTNFTDATVAETVHASRHNDTAAAVNDTVDHVSLVHRMISQRVGPNSTHAAGWGRPGWRLSSTVAAALTSGTLFAWVLPVFHEIAVTDIGINVTSSGNNIRVGVASTDVTGVPTTLVEDFGEIDVTTTGAKQVTGLSRTLAPGRYVLLAQTANGVSLTHYLGTTIGPSWHDVIETITTTMPTVISAARTYAALPSTIPALAVTTSASAADRCPILMKWSVAS